MSPTRLDLSGNVTERIEELKSVQDFNTKTHGGNTLNEPLKYGGSLDKFEHFLPTTIIGIEFPKVQLTDLLDSEDKDILLRDLAILISQRGVCFFRNQNITPSQQKEVVHQLGVLTGKPSTNTLHVHPTTWSNSELGDEITVIDNEEISYNSRFYGRRSELASKGWHSDINFERAPADYSILKIHTLPETGGDTLWASGYEVYDRLSEPYQKFLEGLTAYFSGDRLRLHAEDSHEQLRTSRGSPDNQGLELDSVHPVVRTNPVTGWKSVFTSNNFTQYINELNVDESQEVIDRVNKLVAENHDLQVRFHWSKNDVAIWDNRSFFHTATGDVVGKRLGDRAVSIGERPYLDPESKSRRRALNAQANRIL
jgi:alpha-ketoglutarate-dependent taurine dioxygenase